MIPGLTSYTPRQKDVIDRAARDPVVQELFAHVLHPAAEACALDLRTADLSTDMGRGRAIQLQGALSVVMGLEDSFRLSLKR